jgi:anti-anti-sigma factor
MGADLKITPEQVQGKVPVTIFHLRGWLDAQSEGQLVDTARNAFDQGARFLLLDLSELDTMTSAGIRAVQRVFQMFTPKDEAFKVSHLKLASAPPQIYHVLGITGFLQNVPMYESVQDAVATFGE